MAQHNGNFDFNVHANADFNFTAQAHTDNNTSTMDTTQMSPSERRALPEVLDMVAEYEKSDEYLEDYMKHAGLTEQKRPNAMTTIPPLERPRMHRAMSMELDKIQVAAPPFALLRSMSSSGNSSAFAGLASIFSATKTPDDNSANTASVDIQDTVPMSPKAATHPSTLRKARPTPSADNPWYTRSLDIPMTEQQLFHLLNSVHSACRKYNLEYSPQQFRDLARKVRKFWDKTHFELRQVCDCLQQMLEFVVCGPKDFTLSHALSEKTFRGLHAIATEISPHIEALRSLDGCGWLSEHARDPLREIGRQLSVLVKERVEYKAAMAKAATAKQRPQCDGDVEMGGQ